MQRSGDTAGLLGANSHPGAWSHPGGNTTLNNRYLYRRFAVTFVVAFLWFVAFIAATWPWSVLALATLMIAAFILVRGARNERTEQTEDGQ